MIIEFELKNVTQKKLENCGFVKDRNNSKHFTYDVNYYWNESEEDLKIQYIIDVEKKKIYIKCLNTFTLEINKAYQISEDLKHELIRFEKMQIIKLRRYE